ncbi:hypothetical protein [Listeria newyorkensis]|uniref:hypothetical protein n=1 Tax=Listeria newyorkensis TaxID=1497681 RepID=UPI00051D8004|nr:hypothetical protein [Listeria newyorkensis]KGL44093.1 hypothetical protein EP58_06490 [Listeria newyorkensis]SQC57455.1 Uncharacterised protein [Listeria newyorkensis]
MTRKEAIELLLLINDTYKDFELDATKKENWISVLTKGDFKRSKAALLKYIQTKPYIPAIANFFIPINQDVEKTKAYLDKMKQYQQEAVTMPSLEESALPDDLKAEIKAYQEKKASRQIVPLNAEQQEIARQNNLNKIAELKEKGGI